VNIIVIANCHVQPIRDGLALSSEIDEVFAIPVHLENTIHYTNAIEYIRKSQKEKFTVLEFGGLLQKAALGPEIVSRIERVVSFTNIYFTGLHPDMTYFGGMGRRVSSPLGDYHSKICLLAFNKGLSIDQCEKLFNNSIYQQFDFYTEWTESEAELRKRDEHLDIKFADEFLEMTRLEPTLYTFNHPLGIVFSRFLEKIYKYLGLTSPQFPGSYFYNYLASNAWWPIYPEISEFHKLKNLTPITFKAPDHLSRKFYNLREFISLSYRLYSEQNIREIELPLKLSNYLERISV
jgi:hypothetical protein